MTKRLTFKVDITRKFTFFAIIPSVLIALFLILIIVDLKENSLKESHIKLLKSIDYKLTSLHEELISVEQIIAKSKGKNKFLYNDILYFRDYISSIALLDRNGKTKNIYSNSKVPLNKNFDYSKTLDLKNFLETKKSFLGDTYFCEEANEHCIPYIFESNKTIYIINIKLTYFNDFVKTLVGEDKFIKVCIIDKNGIYIVNSMSLEAVQDRNSFYNTPISKAILFDKEYQFVEFSQKNKTSKVIYANQKETGWKLLVKDEFDTTYDFIQNILLGVVLVLILLFVIVIIVGKKVARSVEEPVESLIHEIEDFADETEYLDITSSIKSKYYIFNVLIESFEQMKNDIVDRELELKSLNEHLEEKTTQLELLNQMLQIKLESQK